MLSPNLFAGKVVGWNYSLMIGSLKIGVHVRVGL
jgi:hypothetical protein